MRRLAGRVTPALILLVGLLIALAMPAVTAATAKSQHKGTQWGRVRVVAGAGGTVSDLLSAPTGELALLVNHNAAIAIKRPGAKARFAHPVMPVSSPTATYGHSMGANGLLLSPL